MKTDVMLTLLPQLLFLKALAPTLLRIALSVYFAYTARFILEKKHHISVTRIPIVGHVPVWAVSLVSFIIAIVSGLLFVGAWTQIAALLGVVIGLKHAYAARYYPTIVPFPPSTYILLFCISLSLIVTGPGAFALDLPL